MSAGSNSFADLEERIVSLPVAFSARLLFVSVRHAQMELIKLLCLERE
jgi:hypothetical protein